MTWERKKFSKFATLQKGISYKSEDYTLEDGGAVFLTIKCFSKSGGFKTAGIKYFDGKYEPSDLLCADDLLIANTDLTRAGDIVGCPVRVPNFGEKPVLMSMDLSKICMNSDEVDESFFYYLLMTHEVRRFMRDHASGSTVLHLQTSAIPELRLWMPRCVIEQRSIATNLQRVDQLISETEALIAKHIRIKTGMTQDLLTKGIDENGQIRSEDTHEFKDSILGRFPVEWDVSPAKQLCQNVIDCKNRTPPVTSGEHPVIRTPNVRDGRFVYDGLVFTDEKSYEVWTARGEPQTGDVLITREAPFGEACLIPDDLSGACLGQRMMLYQPDPEKIVASYLVYAINSERVQKLLFELAGGSTVGHIRVGDVRTLRIPYPVDVYEQMRIAGMLEAVDSQLDSDESRLKKLKRLKQGLMQDLLTGKVRVPVAEEVENIAASATG